VIQVIFELTWSCPCRCAFCQVPKQDKHLPLPNYERTLELFRRRFGGDDCAAVLSGGEPSTVPNLKEYVDVARRLGFEVTVVTNAFNVESILEAEPDLVEVSIDYFGEKHDRARGMSGLFDNAMRLLSLAVLHGISSVVRSTAMRDNIRDILMLRSLLDEKGLRDVPILVMPVRGAPELKPSPQQLKELERSRGILVSDNCPAGISSFAVTPDGEVLACIFYRRRLGALREFTAGELEKILEEGERIPRFPCER